MSLYALLKDGVVSSVHSCEEEEVIQYNKEYQVVDVSNYLVAPLQGWVLSGNKIIPGPGQVVTVKEMVKARIHLYRSRTPDLLVDLYATNTLSGMTDVQSDASFDLHQDVIFCLNEGAFPTAIYRLNKKVNAGLITREVADQWIALIQAAMV